MPPAAAAIKIASLKETTRQQVSQLREIHHFNKTRNDP
jgi:hypothetical protein